MTLLSKSVVLKAPPADDLLREEADALFRTWHKELDLFYLYDGCTERGEGMRVHIWWDPARPDLEIRLVCDDVARLRYFSVSAGEPEEVRIRDALLQRIAARFPVFSVSELRDGVRARPEDTVAWMRLGLGLDGDFDAEAFELLVKALRASEPATRRGAAEAASLLQWPKLAMPLSEAAKTEPEPDVKQVLELAAQVCGGGAQVERQ